MGSRANVKKMPATPSCENAFENYYNRFSINKILLEKQLKFHPIRRWRFDFSLPEIKVAIEIDGGQWAPNGGRHNRDSDREKLNAAASLGWVVLRFSNKMILQDPLGCIKIVDETIKNRIRPKI